MHPKKNVLNSAVALCSLLLTGVIVPTSLAAAQQQFRGEWAIRMATQREMKLARANEPTVHVALKTPGLNTFYLPLNKFVGLTDRIISADARPAHFRLDRDAGSFLYDGVFQKGRGAGQFTFRPNPAFANELIRRGMQRPSEGEQFNLARHGVELEFLAALAELGYAGPSTSTLVKAGMSGADLDYLRDMAALGYRLGTLEELMKVSDEGVTPEWIKQLAELGYHGVSVRELVAMRNEGITVDFIRDANRPAGRLLAPRELVQRKLERPSTPSTVDATPTSGEWIVRQSRNGRMLELDWTDNTQWRRDIAASDLSGVTDSDLDAPAARPVSFRIDEDAGDFVFEGTMTNGRGSGRFQFTPHTAFFSTLRSMGITGTEEVSVHQLKNLAFGGMSARAVRELRQLGVPLKSLGDLTDLAVRQVTPVYVRQLQSEGLTGLNVENLEDLRLRGVTPEIVRAVKGTNGKITPARFFELLEAQREARNTR